jgi:uncharacterized protein YjiS (DUF1127 family)
MAYASTTAPVHAPSIQPLLNIFKSISAAAARRRVYLQTRNELLSLNDRMLADLGITRSEINRVSLDASVNYDK